MIAKREVKEEKPMTSEIENAKITGTMLGNEDHGIFTCYIYLEMDGSGCGFGGYALDTYNDKAKKRVGVGFGIDFITSILKTVGVEKWEDLKGKYVRIDSEGWGGRILRIGHITENKWFDPKKLAEGHIFPKTESYLHGTYEGQE